MKKCSICLNEKEISEFVSYGCKCKELHCCGACFLSHTMEQTTKNSILNVVRCPLCNVDVFKVSGNTKLEARVKEGLSEIYLIESHFIHPNILLFGMMLVLLGVIAVNVVAVLNLYYQKEFTLVILDALSSTSSAMNAFTVFKAVVI